MIIMIGLVCEQTRKIFLLILLKTFLINHVNTGCTYKGKWDKNSLSKKNVIIRMTWRVSRHDVTNYVTTWHDENRTSTSFIHTWTYIAIFKYEKLHYKCTRHYSSCYICAKKTWLLMGSSIRKVGDRFPVIQPRTKFKRQPINNAEFQKKLIFTK